MLLYLICGLLLLLLGVMFCPIPVLLRCRTHPELSLTLHLFGIIPLSWKPAQKGSDSGPQAETQGLFTRWMDNRFVSYAYFRFLRRLFKAVSIRIKRLELVFGTSDPALTAIYMGRIYALIHQPFIRFKTERVTITPDFTRERLEGTVELTAYVKLWRIAAGLLMLVRES